MPIVIGPSLRWFKGVRDRPNESGRSWSKFDGHEAKWTVQKSWNRQSTEWPSTLASRDRPLWTWLVKWNSENKFLGIYIVYHFRLKWFNIRIYNNILYILTKINTNHRWYLYYSKIIKWVKRHTSVHFGSLSNKNKVLICIFI